MKNPGWSSRSRLAEAANEFREVLRLRPLDGRAKENAEFCERLDAVPREPDGTLPREARVQLLQTLLAQGRPASELVGLSEQIGRDDAIMAH